MCLSFEMKPLMALPALLGLAPLVEAAPASSPSVSIASGTIVGRSILGIDTFNGIPFADPPVGPLRLKPPQKLSRNLGTFSTPLLPPACPQMLISSASSDILTSLLSDFLELPILDVVTGQEDCLNLNVQRPTGTQRGDKLPVLVWIYGGGFEFGSTQAYDASSLLSFGANQKQPFVFVAVNYRVGGFGFLPGAQVLADGSANLGLLDQRLALEWVADNIEFFGGDPAKVTLWGESAGSISIFDQMLLYGGNATYNGAPLFRGAIMDSGSAVPAEAVDSPKAQAIYDNAVLAAGCAKASDTLACLRSVPYSTFLHAVNAAPGIFSYTSIALSYLPRPDGSILPASPELLVQQGRYHAVPFIIGDQEDEGTLFALFQTNITSTTRLVGWLSDYLFHQAPRQLLTQLVQTYDTDASAGSPFRTSIFNELYPGFKRTAALLGDLTFTLTRRLVLSLTLRVKPEVPSWSYLASYDWGTPLLGTFHASDVLQVFLGVYDNHAARSIRSYYLNFLYNLDPNVGVKGYANWPEWSRGETLMWFEDADYNGYLADDFRNGSYQFIAANMEVLRV